MSEIVKSSGVTGGIQIRTVADMQNVAGMLAKSGYFSDARDMAQCFTKVLAGNEMGIGAFAAMTGIHIIKGKPSVGAGLMASCVKSHPDYNYRVLEHTAVVCKIEFYERWDGQLKPVGVSEFTIQDAKAAGTQNIQKFPKNMLFARAMSNGVKWYCPNIFDAPVYTPEELGASVDGEGNVIDVQPVVDQPNPITQRFNFIAEKTGHDKDGAVAAATAVGVPPSSKQMSPDQFILFRNRLLAEWGMNMGAFKAVNHAMNSLKHVDGFDGPNDAAVWDAWEVKVGMKLAEAKPVDAEFIPAGEDLLGTPSLGVNEIQGVGA